jgi:TldD protein
LTAIKIQSIEPIINAVDDEGTQTQNTTLIENGILKGYMFDKMNAKLKSCR